MNTGTNVNVDIRTNKQTNESEGHSVLQATRRMSDIPKGKL